MNPTRTTFALPNHPNRSRAASAARNPTPDEIVGERFNARLTQTEAARLIHSTLRTWQDWEAGKARMHPGLWELFILRIHVSPR